MFSGSITALATPFLDHGIDEKAFEEFVSWQIAEGSKALAACTVIGEGPTLQAREYRRLIEIAAATSAGRVPVLAGINANCTARGCEQAEVARSAGADALIVPTPAYNKPSQEGIFRHVETITQAGLPIFVQNIPDRTNIELTVGTMERLARLQGVVGFIDGSGQVTGSTLSVLSMGKRLDLLTPRDAAAVSFNFAGGSGALSVVANIAPRLCARLQRACAREEWKAASEIQEKLQPLCRAIDQDGSPAPLKYALFLMRPHFNPQLRLPLVEATCGVRRMVAAALAGLKSEVAFA